MPDRPRELSCTVCTDSTSTRLLRMGLKSLLNAVLLLAQLCHSNNCGSAAPEEPDRGAIAAEALSRLKGIDLDANPGVKAAVVRVLDQARGTPQFVEIVRDFKIK